MLLIMRPWWVEMTFEEVTDGAEITADWRSSCPPVTRAWKLCVDVYEIKRFSPISKRSIFTNLGI